MTYGINNILKFEKMQLDVPGTFGDNNTMNIAMEVLMDGLCCIKGCVKPICAVGLCTEHYRNNRIHGSPVVVRQLSAANRGLTAEQRFWKSVEKTEGGCWLWNAGRDKDGYGIFDATIYGVRVVRAHRFSHILHTGEILKPEVMVLHSCHNPPCCNPDHLRSGTGADHADDRKRAGRHHISQKARFMQIAKLSDEQVYEILRDPRPYVAIAEEYSVHKQTVQSIKARTTRWDVDIDPELIVKNKRGLRGEARSKRLTDDDVRAIRASTERNVDLARKYKMSEQQMSGIRSGNTWKHVQ